ncbi:XRE family transcriptional regulator [Flagellimonas alvinocaridis]|uniref:XRE family transcriptional regulator n=3 Tax=Flavobacteriaceae TaxID=49546 RepID=A0A4S8RRM1_9FLAO|nr:transcriptional regulator [Allomuricauda olearia]THV60411.1 XRE family transcriptional regulator [Allomuricauda alvinocaridis]
MDKEELKMKLRKRLVQLREEKGLRQADLAYACGKDRQALEKIENGRVNPTVYTLYEIAQVLEVPLLELFRF